MPAKVEELVANTDFLEIQHLPPDVPEPPFRFGPGANHILLAPRGFVGGSRKRLAVDFAIGGQR